MPPLIVFLFYVWLIGGAGLFIYRRSTGIPLRSRKAASGKDHTMLADKILKDAPRSATAEFQTANDTVGDSPVLGIPVQTTVGELVTGIALPCGLVPYLGELVDNRVVLDRVVFFSTTSGMDAVVEGLQSELMRLGFAVAKPRDNHLIATSSGGELDVRIASPPPGGTHASYPDVSPGAVVVELTTG